MKMYVISDSLDVVTGMRLAGLGGVLVQNKDEAANALKHAMEQNLYGIILVTQGISEGIEDEIRAIKLEKSLPVVTVIPDRNTDIKSNYITDHIKQSIGLKI